MTDPPIGATNDPPRRSVTSVLPAGALLCFFTDGLIERRGQVIDRGIDQLAATLGRQVAAGPGDTAHLAADDACTEVMRTLVGNARSPDDVAVLMLSRRFGASAPRRHKSCCGPKTRQTGLARDIPVALQGDGSDSLSKGGGLIDSDQLESPELKKDAKLPAIAVTTKIAHASSATSMTFPTAVTGLVIDDDTDSS